ncbi:MAG TPA: alpha-isopropylmalate synthase regulatory domain-containing protein, partial [Promineifilum sp.]|nr:alpha-isopropylmalate synthase regulatory domain-containing protein [Promineifilum sp.]
YSGHGASTDIVVASARAYLSALNKLLAERQRQAAKPQASNGHAAVA